MRFHEDGNVGVTEEEKGEIRTFTSLLEASAYVGTLSAEAVPHLTFFDAAGKEVDMGMEEDDGATDPSSHVLGRWGRTESPFDPGS